MGGASPYGAGGPPGGKPMGPLDYAFFLVPIFDLTSFYWNYSVVTSDITQYWNLPMYWQLGIGIFSLTQVVTGALGLIPFQFTILGKMVQAVLEILNIAFTANAERKDGIDIDKSTIYSLATGAVSLIISALSIKGVMGGKPDYASMYGP